MIILDIVDKRKKLTINDFIDYEKIIKENNVKITDIELKKLVSQHNVKNFLDLLSETDELEKIDNKLIDLLLSVYFFNDDIDNKSNDDEIIDGNRQYINSLPSKLLSKEEILEYAYKYQNGDMKAGEIIIKNNLRLVMKIAGKYIGKGLDYDDLIQEGNIGLIDALKRFNPDYGYSFTTYSIFWIRQRITKAIKVKSRIIKIPDNVYDLIKKMEAIKNSYIMKNGKEPSDEELAKLLNISTKKIIELKNASYDAGSYNQTISDDDEESELYNFIEDKKANFENDLVQKDEIENELYNCLYSSGLSKMEIEVLKLRYGFYEGKIYSTENIASMMNVIPYKIKRMEMSSLNRIRQISEYKKNSNNKNNNIFYYNIYTYFNEFNDNLIDKSINMLDPEKKNILHKVYGDNLKYPYFDHKAYACNRFFIENIIKEINDNIDNILSKRKKK